ncbi:MarR family transcriptional regulator [Paenarthrobacter ureafaciens]|uniref:MarR family transcriptional regulator n=1 Tax=Paenarthrobacter ureafaciens TaxID=37931 RepID=UPI001FB40AE2|nr:MarR family transcriptional regulator [Paenarthrobacter ureafaciens]UOD79893.1 MarR family transcriptional regulator [Paenarthrobacter ureafaciens]WNZ04765.1 MarR family transcriptional regulator [Paenarthrobacter ureafaciens]
MSKPIGYWVKRLDAALEAQLDHTLARMRLSRRQWQALNTLAEASMLPEELEEALQPFWGEDVRLRERELAALVGRGMITMIDDRLVLSGKGRETYHQARRLVEETRNDLSVGIGIDEYAMAVSVLERMSRNAERLSK